MKKTIYILFITIICLSCNHTKKKEGIDFDKITPKLNLSSDQKSQFNQIIDKYEIERSQMVEEIRASGNMNKANFMKNIHDIFGRQGEEMKSVLSTEQFSTYEEFVKKSLPGRINHPEKLIEKIKVNLKLDSSQIELYDAINQAFERAYIEAHDKYHGNNEAAKSYWNQFDQDRKNALKKVFSEKQLKQYLEFTKNETFRGEHGNGEES